jgi:hypothetical protein
VAAVVLGNAVELASNIAAAVHLQRAVEAASTASALLAASSSRGGADFYTAIPVPVTQ